MFSILHISYRRRIAMKRDRIECLFADVLEAPTFSSPAGCLYSALFRSLVHPVDHPSAWKYRDEIDAISVLFSTYLARQMTTHIQRTWVPFFGPFLKAIFFLKVFKLISNTRNLLWDLCLRFEIGMNSCSFDKNAQRRVVRGFNGTAITRYDDPRFLQNAIRERVLLAILVHAIREPLGSACSYGEEDRSTSTGSSPTFHFSMKGQRGHASVHSIASFEYYGYSWILRNNKRFLNVHPYIYIIGGWKKMIFAPHVLFFLIVEFFLAI